MAGNRGNKSKGPKVAARRTPKRGGPWRLLGKLCLLGAVLGVCGVAVVAGLFLYYGSDPSLPRIDHIRDYRPKVVSKVLDRDGRLLGEIYEERRTVVPFERIPPVMIHALVDAEDAQFYEHAGLNYYGMLRAVLYNLRPGAHLQGASTLTQQLVKTYLLKTTARTIKRKVQEAILARRLESKLSKDEILYLYLNQIYFGHGRYGVEEAARFYFGKSISDVDIGEAALLASLPKGPEEISPLKHPERAKERQRYVLSQMQRYGHITAAQAEHYANAPIVVVARPDSIGDAPEFVDEARRQLSERFGKDELPYLGKTVTTTCDARIERVARAALERGLENLDERQGYRKPLAHLKLKAAGGARVEQEIGKLLDARALRQLRRRLGTAPTKTQRQNWLTARRKAFDESKVTEAVVVEVRTGADEYGLVLDNGVGRAFLREPRPPAKAQPGKPGDGAQPDRGDERYNPKGLPLEQRFSVGDVLTVRTEPSLGRHVGIGKHAGKADGAAHAEDWPLAVPEFGPQGAVVVLDPATRDVLAMVGGYDFQAGGYNRALRARRQPGSSFKPFLYAAAFASKKYTLASLVNDSPQIYEQPGLQDWRPRNAETQEFLGPVRLRVALAKSLNTVASQLIYDLTPAVVAKLAHDVGITSPLDETLALGLGSSVVSPIELTNAYATFDAQGRVAEPRFIEKIDDEALPADPAHQAIDPALAYVVTSMMESVIQEGTGASARAKLRRPAAGKTGTTSSERDAWFVGYTPDLVVGVWVGFDDMRDLGRGEQGARSALPVWTDVLLEALKNRPPTPFQQPPGVEVRRIDPVTGLLAPAGSSTGLDEVFLEGTAPTQEAPQAGLENPDTFMMQ